MTPSSMVTAVLPDDPHGHAALAAFAAALHAEPRYFGRRGVRASRPSPSLVHRLVAQHELRLAGLIDGEIVALGAIDGAAQPGPELLIAVAAPWRGQGIATAVGRELLELAASRGLPRVVLRTSYRSSDVRAAAEALGLEAVDLGLGRLSFERPLERRSA